MSRGPDAGTLLERALIADAVRCGTSTRVIEASATRWASATFAGARHILALTGPHDDAARRWLASLPEAELVLRGHLVADLAVVRQSHDGERCVATIEALTVEDRP